MMGLRLAVSIAFALVKFTRAKPKRQAIVTAVTDFNTRHRMAALIRHSGRFRSLMTNEEIEALHAREPHHRARSLKLVDTSSWVHQMRPQGDPRRTLREYEAVIPKLPIDEAVWQVACVLARRSRQAGRTIPASDILVCACARHHRVEIEHADAHFAILATL